MQHLVNDIEWTACKYCQMGLRLWVNVIGSMVPGKGSQSPKGPGTDPVVSHLKEY